MNQPRPKIPSKAMQLLYQQSQDAWERHDYQKSIGLLEQASRKEPSNPNIPLLTARLCGLRYDYSAAQRHIEQALKVSHYSVQTLEEAARVCLAFKNLDLMLGCLERACEKPGVSLDALASLADIYLLDNRVDQAGDIIARAARINRNDPRVLQQEAVLKLQRGEVKEAESLFRDLLINSAADITTRTRAAYRLANLLDAAGQYDEAMSALLEAKALQRPQGVQLAPTLQRMHMLNREMEQSLTAAVLERWKADGAKLQPPQRLALLSGHPRSGTTLLEQVLDSHSGIVSTEETSLMHDEVFEPLARDYPPGTGIFQMFDSAPPSVLARGRENYFRCSELFLGQPIGDRLLVDKNPGVSILIPIMARFFPEAKFLIALRDPRDVVMSCFMQALQLTPASSAYLTLGGTVSQYASVMGLWTQMLPRLGDQGLKVRYEEMVDDLPKVAKSTLQFLGLNYEENVLKFHEHARSKRVNSPTQADVKKPLYRTAVGRWRNYEKYLEPYLGGLEPFLKEFNY